MSDENVKATEDKATVEKANSAAEDKATEEKAKPAAKDKATEAKAKPAAEKKAAVEKAPVAEEKAEPAIEEPKAETPKLKIAPPPAGSQFHATGRRKRSIARVYITPGNGEITVNKRPIENYFFRGIWRYMVAQPLELTGTGDLFNVKINVRGGGQTGQAGAVKQALARALCEFSSELRPALKKAGFLMRDARVVERKKYGLAGARKRFQFSKR